MAERGAQSGRALAHLRPRDEYGSTQFLGGPFQFQNGRAHSFVLQVLPLAGYSSPRQPSPARQSAPWRVEEPKIISIAHTSHLAKKASAAPERRLDAGRLGDAS